MNINQRINNNFEGIILKIIEANTFFPEVSRLSFFKGFKDPRFEPDSIIRASKKMKRQNNLIGVGLILRNENTYNYEAI